jgi:hypothetical protein
VKISNKRMMYKPASANFNFQAAEVSLKPKFVELYVVHFTADLMLGIDLILSVNEKAEHKHGVIFKHQFKLFPR